MWAVPVVCGLVLAEHMVDNKLQVPKMPHTMQEQQRLQEQQRQQEMEAAAAAAALAEESRGRERTISRTKSQVTAQTASSFCCSRAKPQQIGATRTQQTSASTGWQH